MKTTIIAAILGCLGGLTKSLIGIFKAKARGDKIKLGLVFRTIRLSSVSGTFMGAMFSFNPIVSFIAGYVGSDILEGIYYSLKRTKIGKKCFEL